MGSKPIVRPPRLVPGSRLTLVARGGRIERVFYPVFPPDRNAADVVAWLDLSGVAP